MNRHHNAYKEPLLFLRKRADFVRYHVPTVDSETQNANNYETELIRYLSCIYDHLGEETLKRWFAEDEKDFESANPFFPECILSRRVYKNEQKLTN